MIRVSKPRAPRRLARGEALTRKDCEAYEARRGDYERGTSRFWFRRNIYGHNTVREALKDAHNGKCCFCEGKKFRAFSPADVEHYRPKGSIRQKEQSKAALPGYFWLAYSWDNLYWCCQTCNRSNKRDFFPLKNPAKRARSTVDNLAEEKPLILDPGGLDDPRDHIGFHREIAVALTEAGRTTIQFVGLNRSELEEDRRAWIEQLYSLSKLVEISKRTSDPELAALARDASRTLEAAVSPKAEFSAMATKFIEHCA